MFAGPHLEDQVALVRDDAPPAALPALQPPGRKRLLMRLRLDQLRGLQGLPALRTSCCKRWVGCPCAWCVSCACCRRLCCFLLLLQLCCINEQHELLQRVCILQCRCRLRGVRSTEASCRCAGHQWHPEQPGRTWRSAEAARRRARRGWRPASTCSSAAPAASSAATRRPPGAVRSNSRYAAASGDPVRQMSKAALRGPRLRTASTSPAHT